LLPSANRDAWRPAKPTTHDVAFHCPRCGREWHAELVGDDVRPLHTLDEVLPVV
jgi:hypothetical protein